jgi:hypothetical protein
LSIFLPSSVVISIPVACWIFIDTFDILFPVGNFFSASSASFWTISHIHATKITMNKGLHDQCTVNQKFWTSRIIKLSHYFIFVYFCGLMLMSLSPVDSFLTFSFHPFFANFCDPRYPPHLRLFVHIPTYLSLVSLWIASWISSDASGFLIFAQNFFCTSSASFWTRISHSLG